MSAKAVTSDEVKVAKAKPIEVKEKPFYLIAYRQRHEDPWTIKANGAEPFRDKKLAEDMIPPPATEAHIIEVVLPL